MEDQGLISSDNKDSALEELTWTENHIEKKMDQKRQKQIAQLKQKMANRRRKVRSCHLSNKTSLSVLDFCFCCIFYDSLGKFSM